MDLTFGRKIQIQTKMFKHCSSADVYICTYIYMYIYFIEYSLPVDALMCKQNYNFGGGAN